MVIRIPMSHVESNKAQGTYQRFALASFSNHKQPILFTKKAPSNKEHDGTNCHQDVQSVVVG